ncbi:MAG: triose-phosphate isomerase [Chloroflexi bacterium 44-23]|nr:MAG: triose-phosphate isomerase [Chloroflexi bacterium 44-23]
MRKPFVAGNWKMHKTASEAIALVDELQPKLADLTSVEIVFCVPFTALCPVANRLKASPIGLGAQNVHWENQGAFTGEISAAMILEFGQYVIIGHSERRTYFCETDETVNKRMQAALNAGLHVIVCVGETLEENEKSQTEEVITRQMRIAFNDIDLSLLKDVVIAYEPVWAIGTGLACDAQKANEIIKYTIRKPIIEMYGEEAVRDMRVLYGGSVKGSNAKEYFVQPDIDGALVGGAALKPEFIEIVRAAA